MSDPVAALLAKEEIRGVLADLARGTDRLDGELIRSCYHADALDDHNAFRGGPAEFADWVLANLPHFAATMHFLGNMRIELSSADLAWCETYCVAHHLFKPGDPDGERDLVLGLRYFDRFERRAAQPGAEPRWKIALRRCVFDWSYTVPIAEKWPFAPEFTVGKRDRSDPTYRRA